MTAASGIVPPVGLRRWMAAGAGIGGTLVYVFSLANIGVALPHMQGAFSAAPDQIAWVVTAFVVASTLTTASAGWFSSRFGRRRVYLISIAGFTAASALGGFADTLGNEVAVRALQGLFGAPLVPLGQAITVDAFPRGRQGFATSLWGMGAVWGTMLGPLTGGYLVEHLGWPWVFHAIVPLGAAAWLLSWTAVSETAGEAERRFDWFGFAALTVAIVAFTLMLNRGERLDWFASPQIVAAGAVAAGVFYLFVVHSLTTRQPFLDPRLLRDRNYAAALLLIFIYGGYSFLPLFVLPLLLTGVMGYPLTTVGILLASRAIGVTVGLAVIARLVDRIDPRYIIVAGFVFLIVPQWAMSGWTSEIGWVDVLWVMILQGAGSGVTFVPISTMAFATLPARSRTEGLAIFHLLTNLGTAIGIALFFNLLSRSTRVNEGILAEHVSPFNELFRFPLPRQAYDLSQSSDLAALSAEISRQATMIAFNGTFYMSAVLGLIVLPLIFVLRKPRAAAGTGGEE